MVEGEFWKHENQWLYKILGESCGHSEQSDKVGLIKIASDLLAELRRIADDKIYKGNKM